MALFRTIFSVKVVLTLLLLPEQAPEQKQSSATVSGLVLKANYVSVLTFNVGF